MTKKPKPAQPFAARLRTLRTAAGLSVAELAERIGISRQALHALESGRSDPALSTLTRLAAALGVSLDRLAG